MTRAFCTFGMWDYKILMDLSRPSFQIYCGIHGYDYVEPNYEYRDIGFRPPSWGKVLLLHELLNKYDEVVWVDCDALVIDFSVDIFSQFPSDKIQAMAFHEIGPSRAPSCGTWMMRKEMQPYLVKIWNLYKYTEHPFWEQAALQELMGYEQDENFITPMPMKVQETELSKLTHELPYEWASFSFRELYHQPKILHFPTGSVVERKEGMEKWITNENSKMMTTTMIASLKQR